MVKADAYGHGAVHVARRLASEGIDRFAVALVEEAVELRRSGLEGDILVMGPCQPEQRTTVARFDLVPTVSSRSQLETWLDWGSEQGPQPVHLKVNTGMNRLGLAPEELHEALAAVRSSSSLRLAGLMSHFSSAEDLENPSTARQRRLFVELVDLLADDERRDVEVHIANSAALLHGETPHWERGRANVARPGLALLGYDPARRLDLEPVMSVVARITQIQRVAAGETVGYGERWSAERPGFVGIAPVGYADGYCWRLGGRADALVDGRRARVVGAVSMDMIALDLGATSPEEGSEVVLLGTRDGETIDAVELARHAGSIVYEVLCGFGLRLPKVYLSQGRTLDVVSRLPTDPPAGRQGPTRG